MNVNLNKTKMKEKGTYEKENYEKRYEKAIHNVEKIASCVMDEQCNMDEDIRDYYIVTSKFLLLLNSINEMQQAGIYDELGIDELKDINRKLYSDIACGCYEESFANPEVAVRKLGQDYGLYLCLLYVELRTDIAYTYEKKIELLVASIELYEKIYSLSASGKLDDIKPVLYQYFYDHMEVMIEDRFKQIVLPECSFANDIISNADLADLRYLYRYGEYISVDETGVAKFLSTFSEDEIHSMASTFTEGFRKGFLQCSVKLDEKSVVAVRYPIGFERIVREVICQFRKMGLETTTYRYPLSVIHKNTRGIRMGFMAVSVNPQYDYDHRLDIATLFDGKLAERMQDAQRNVYIKWKDAARRYAGPAVMDVFGRTPFTPIVKKEASSFSEEQLEIYRKNESVLSLIENEFMPGDETSYTVMMYPVPEIGTNFENIFRATVQVNTLNQDEYEPIQSTLIDALNKAEYVTVTGRNNNHTSLKVALPKIMIPDKQTNFENCLADINIPLGEVFTTPQLEGTEGVLHVKKIYLMGLRYEDLELTFVDGIVTGYSCHNYDYDYQNKRFIEQNLLCGHKNLPMGEFAIGTNTTAYTMGKKYNISHLLPILIAEKTGPHFAVGDTCFSHEEDIATFNPDGKEMVAKENTYSRMRNSNPEKAYFNCHTDITIPYDELGDIVVHMEDRGLNTIIRDGRFVLKGTEKLNQAIKEL